MPAGVEYRQRTVLVVESIGYLVPGVHFDGTVHSVFARTCNIACDQWLLTLSAPGHGEGPTTLLLGGHPAADLRTLFRPGDRVQCRDGYAQSRRVAFRVREASIWRPAPPGFILPDLQIATNLRVARASLAARRRSYSSVIDRDGGTTLAALGEACRELDDERALLLAERLIGWGEGLTPAGDDFLVGCLAALDVLADNHGGRRNFVSNLGAAIAARGQRTTPIAAHYLRLAAQAHFNSDVHRLRAAMLCACEPASLQRALDGAFAAGATSGADLVTGLLSGFSAWFSPRAGQ